MSDDPSDETRAAPAGATAPAAPSPALPAMLLEKLKLLPLRERELSTLRQAHQQQLRWIEGTQQLMVRLTMATSLPEALDGLVNSLVDQFGFDLSAVVTHDVLLAGDAASRLAPADREFLDRTILAARERRDLVVSEAQDEPDERTISWLIGGMATTGEKGQGPVVIVGRTRRTAPYFPKPAGEEAGLYRHLLSTLAQVFKSIELQANHHSELERKVAERTAELRAVQERVVELEKAKVAEQMAGGFAHEMRNALSGAKILIEKGMGAGNADGRTVIDDTAGELQRMFLMARERFDAESLTEFKQRTQQIARNERLLAETLSSVHRSIQRALAITAQIMEYSRVGFSRRGSHSVDLVEIARGVLAESQSSLDQFAIQTALLAAAPCPISAEETHLYSILKNLVVNAIDALREVQDGRQRWLRVEITRGDDRVVCRVMDNANGIPEGCEKRIFEPFFSTKPQTGTGLGLGMVLKLLALHDGSIELESRPGAGTTFEVIFSTAQAPASAPDIKPLSTPGVTRVVG